MKASKRLIEVVRPWGDFKQFSLNEKCTVKLLTLKPKQELSLQSHKNRQENWYFLTKGVAQVGEKRFHVKEGDYIRVKKHQKHRVISENSTVRFMEISFGTFDEHDEKRYEDKYGRK
jgi:mannose-6-phosphate isomerase